MLRMVQGPLKCLGLLSCILAVAFGQLQAPWPSQPAPRLPATLPQGLGAAYAPASTNEA